MPRLAFVAALLVTHAFAAVDQQKIDDVAAGKLTEAKASWWGFDAADATACLQAAINSKVPKLIVDNFGQPWVVNPIKLISSQEILFEKGVEIQAKPGSYLGTGDCLFEARNQHDITLRGYGATFRMRRDDYAKPPYKKAEWRHTLSFMSCSNVKVYGLTLAESGGDGIYLGTATRGVTNKGVLIKDVVCDRNYRQGISVITAEDLTIEDTVMKDTGGTAPMAGIDFEPNEASERLVNVVMRRCTVQGNRGDGYDIYIPTLHGDSEPVSMRFESCRAVGDNGCGLRLVTGNAKAAAVLGSIAFVDCVFERSTGSGIQVWDKPVEGLKLTFERCQVLDPAAGTAGFAPILLGAGQTGDQPVGGIVLDVLVRDALERKPFAFADSSDVGLQEVTGTLRLERGGKTVELPLTKEQLAEWVPATRYRALPRVALKGLALLPVGGAPAADQRVAPFAWLRGKGLLGVYARQGETVSLTFEEGQVGNYGGRAMPIEVTGPDGKVQKVGEAEFQQATEVSFTAPADGFYRVSADAGANRFRVTAASHAVVLIGEPGSVHLIGAVGRLYFWVPKGTREFAVRVYGEGVAEAVQAALLDPSGKTVDEKDDIASVHQFEVVLPQPSAGEAWSIRLNRPAHGVLEDHYVDLRGVPPLLGASAEGLLTP
ncbi:MAG: right-handed parallel beta-helix repeat-containing protein [Armatimonadetes bacterium]|nr:right-handed parallel beta-helix repeat-containing protein [Armatimonadota bacterium]